MAIPKKTKPFFHKFHDRIRKLLSDGGFNIERSDYYRKGADIFAVAENNRVIVHCRCSKKEGTPYSRLDSLIGEYSTKARKERARVAVLALENYRIPEEYQRDEKKDSLLKQEKVIVWDNKEIKYYKELVKAVGPWARYPMLGDLGRKKEFAKPVSVSCMKVKQRASEFGVFTISPEIMLQIADVFRRARSPKAYQRMVDSRRVKQEISRDFLQGKQVSRPMFPTNLVCVFKDGAKFNEKKSTLTIPMRYSSVWVVDGQHRLYSFCHVSDATIRKEFNLLCAGFNIDGIGNSGLNLTDQAEMFATINQKAKRVPQDLLIDILLKTGKADRRMRIVEKLSKTKVFESKIKTVDRPGHIHIATFVFTSPMKGLVGDEEHEGILSKWFGRKREQRIISADEEEKYVDHCSRKLKSYFSVVKVCFKKEWMKPNKYVLATDRGIRGLLRIAQYIFEYTNGLEDINEAKNVMRALRDFDFRNTELKRMYLGEGGADELMDEWIGRIQEQYPKFGPQPKLTEYKILPNQANRAEGIIKKTLSTFDGEVIGELMNIDPTTCHYLSWIPRFCTTKILFHGVDEWENCLEKLKKLPHKSITIKEIRLLDGRRFIHERWLADNKQKIDFNLDLKTSAIRSGGYTITISDRPRITERYRVFNKIWNLSPDELTRDFRAKTERKWEK